MVRAIDEREHELVVLSDERVIFRPLTQLSIGHFEEILGLFHIDIVPQAAAVRHRSLVRDVS